MTWQTLERTNHEEGIVRITLDRPDTHNAISPQLIDELDEALKEAEDEEETRVIIIDGNGPSFSSGHDLGGGEDGFQDSRRGWSAEKRLSYEQEYYWERSMDIRDLRVPTITQIHGYCGAAGLMLMSVCDLAVASADATFQQPVNRMASAATELLLEPWEMGFRKAKEFIWTGDPISGPEAERLGLVNKAVPEEDLDEETMVLATKLARQPPFALQLSKKTINHAENQVGRREAMYSHFLAHQLTHQSDEWTDWHDEAGEKWEEEGLRAWLNHRDDRFDIETMEDIEETRED
ncbi:enoyl-CoA hydratase-related protein [Halomarina salina]|uniref:Enoyl-CoA hydratase-related protein n=1 Tax=Halomarina salina TaxID=1872699 RepID=A0ABD5RTR9_9EURY|nr:enoyl-CoA hydratase-related protein [Halomarina salina]